MESLWRDLEYAFRAMRRNPGFASVAVVSLALGIGANTTIFTLINAVFLNPLRVERPRELVAVFTGVPVLLCAVAFVSSFIPARRASRVNPLTALREA